MTKNYQELSIREEIKKSIAEMGFTEMTEIQQKAIPELLAGREVEEAARMASAGVERQLRGGAERLLPIP